MKRFCLILLALFCWALPAFAVEPGSKDDPVITRSYLETLYSWQVTNMQEGQSLSLDLGVLVIVRSGRAAVAGVGSEGLMDLTAGKELKDGETIPPCHLIMSPASDRRGIKALSAAVLITRGISH